MKNKGKKILKYSLAAGVGMLAYRQYNEMKKFANLVIGNEKIEKVPILMLHGVNGSRLTMQGMINRWQDKKIAYKALQIEVSPEGELKVAGMWNKDHHGLQPIIQVFFTNNDASSDEQCQWITQIMLFLKEKLDVEEIYLMGHSMGGVALLHYLLHSNKNNINGPIPLKLATLGTPFKGKIVHSIFSQIYNIEKVGERSFDANYEYFMENREYIPSNLKVLNIYGDIQDESQSDGLIANKNTLILKDIIGANVKSYEERKIEGLGGQHTLLHENSEVDELLIAFFNQDKDRKFDGY